MIPKFAIVGRSNKGKSSIVASLVEDDTISIAPTPRTTKHCQEFTMVADGQELFTIIDTPGFEEAPAVLEWLQSKPTGAHERALRVREFLTQFDNSDQYKFERELLTPIMNGAAILYVADASKPFRSHYESEFEILRWTGQASMALVNQIGSSDYSQEWTAALNQYFRKVSPFNAHRSLFQDRLKLLEELRVIHESVRPAIDKSIITLRRQHNLRMQNSLAILSNFVLEAKNFRIKAPIDKQISRQSQKDILLQEYAKELQEKEEKARKKIKKLFNYKQLESQKDSIPQSNWETDIFSKESFETFGLSRSKLITAATAAGALAGGSLDVMVGGTSFMLGSGIGALLGGGGSAYLSFIQTDIAGIKVQKAKLIVGPNRNPNFPWVLLDRNLFFLDAILHRTHAMQEEMNLDMKPERRGLLERLPSKLLRRISRIFKQSSWNIPQNSLEEDLSSAIMEIIDREMD